MAATTETIEQVEQATGKYKYGFVTDIESEKAPKGLDEDTIRFISAKKEEPEWMLEWRLKAFGHLGDSCLGQPGQRRDLCRRQHLAMPVRERTKHDNGVICHSV